MLDNDIVWVKLVYNDGSESMFRATRNREIIECIIGHTEEKDVFCGKVLEDKFLFKVENQVLFELIGVKDIIVTEDKPSLERGVDRFANSYI